MIRIVILLLVFSCPYKILAIEKTNNLTNIKYRKDEEVNVFKLQVENVILKDILLVYVDNNSEKIFIPFNDVIDGLEFSITFNSIDFIADGWFFEKENIFNLDLNTASVTIDNKKMKIDNTQVELHESDLYVEINVFEKWFDLTLNVDFNNLTILVESIKPLPIQIELEKENKRKKILSYKKRNQNKIYTQPPNWFYYPSMSVNLQTNYNDKAINTSATILGSSLIYGQHAKLRINKTANDINPKLSIEDKNIDNKLFGLIGTEYRFGDINSYSIPMIANGISGRGVFFSTSPMSSFNSEQSGKIEFRGELPVGYEVDLMKNNHLIAFQDKADENGEYYFITNVRPGLNQFKLIFYGENGQKYEKEEQFYVPVSFIGDGGLSNKINILQEDSYLFIDNNDDKVNTRYQFETQYGINHQSLLYLGLAQYHYKNNPLTSAIIKYGTSWSGIRSDISLVLDSETNKSVGVKLLGTNSAINWDLEYHYLIGLDNEYIDSVSSFKDPKHLLNSSVSGILPWTKTFPFYFKHNGIYGEEKTSDNFSASISKSYNNINLTSRFSYKHANYATDNMKANFQFNSNIKSIMIRGDIGFHLLPTFSFNTSSIGAYYHFYNRDSVFLKLGYVGGVYNANFGFNKSFNNLKLGINSSINNQGAFSIGLNFSTNLGFSPQHNNWFVTKDNLVNLGGIKARVFRDKNENGIFDYRDNLVKGVGFTGINKVYTAETDKNGIVYYKGIQPYSRIPLKVDPSTFDDIYLYADNKNLDYLVKPSQILEIDFPIVFKGEIDGQFNLLMRGKTRAAESINVDLFSWRTGSVVSSIKTEYDGFILFREIPAGKYYVRPDYSQLTSLNYCIPEEKNITLSEQDPFVGIDNFTIYKKNQIGHRDVLLWTGTNIIKGKKIWQQIQSVLQKIIFSSTENAFAYLRTFDTKNWQLYFADIKLRDANRYCNALKKNGFFCKVQINNNENCPVDLQLLEQIKIIN